MKNREFKGQLKGFPVEVVEKMLERQVEKGNPRDVSVFEKYKWSVNEGGGFTWSNTIEGDEFWWNVIGLENFDMFFERYPNKNKKLKKFKKYLKSKGYQLDTEAGLNEYVADHTWKDLYELFEEYFNSKKHNDLDDAHIELLKITKKLFNNNDITTFKLVFNKKFGKFTI